MKPEVLDVELVSRTNGVRDPQNVELAGCPSDYTSRCGSELDKPIIDHPDSVDCEPVMLLLQPHRFARHGHCITRSCS